MMNTATNGNESYSTPQRRRRHQQSQRHGASHHHNNHNGTMIPSSSSIYSSPSLISSDDGSCSTGLTTPSSTRRSVKTSRTSNNNTTIISIHVEYKCCSNDGGIIKRDQNHQKQQQTIEPEWITHVMDLSKEIVQQQDNDGPQQGLHCISPDHSSYSNNTYVNDDADDDDDASFATALSSTSIDSVFVAMNEEQEETEPVHPHDDHNDTSVSKSFAASNNYEDDTNDSSLCADHHQQHEQHDTNSIKDVSSLQERNNFSHHHQQQHSHCDDSTSTSKQTNHDNDAVTMKADLEESFFQVSQAETIAGEMQDTIQELSQQTLIKWWTDVTADEKMPTNIGIPDFVATAITSLQNLQQQLFSTTHCGGSTTNSGPTTKTYLNEESSSSLSILPNKDDDTRESARTSSLRFGQLDGNHTREWLETLNEGEEIHGPDCDDIIGKNDTIQQDKCCAAVTAGTSASRTSVSTATSSSDVICTAAKNNHHDIENKAMNHLDHAEMDKNMLTTHLAAQIQTSSVEMICYETDQMASIVQQLVKQQQDAQDMLNSCSIKKENDEATMKVNTTILNGKNPSSIKMEPSGKATKDQTTRMTSPPLILRQRRPKVSGRNTFRRSGRYFLTRLVVVVLVIISSSAFAMFTMHKSKISVIVYKQGFKMAVHRRKVDVVSFADDKIQSGAIFVKQAIQQFYKKYDTCINFYSSFSVTKTRQIVHKFVVESQNKWELFLRTYVPSLSFVDEFQQVINNMNVRISHEYQGALPDISTSIVKKVYYKNLRTFIIEMVGKWSQMMTFITSPSRTSIGEALSVTNNFVMDVFHKCQSIFPCISIEEVYVVLVRQTIKGSFDLRESWYQYYQKVATLPEIMCFGKAVQEMKKMVIHSSHIHERILHGVATKLPHFSTSNFLAAVQDTYQIVGQNLVVATEDKMHQMSLISRFYPLIAANATQVLIATQNLFVDKLHKTLEILMDQFVNCYQYIFDFYQKYAVSVASAKMTAISRDRDLPMYSSDFQFLDSWDYQEDNDSNVPLL